MKFYLPTLKHLVIQLAKLQIYTVNLTTTFWHRKKNPITFEQECTCNTGEIGVGDSDLNLSKWLSKPRVIYRKVENKSQDIAHASKYRCGTDIYKYILCLCVLWINHTCPE